MPKIIHLSLFPNQFCVICQEEVEDDALHCEGCSDEYLNRKEKENEKQD